MTAGAYAPTNQKIVTLQLEIQVLSADIKKISITILPDPRGGMRIMRLTRRRLGIRVSVYLYALYMMLNKITDKVPSV